MQNVLSLVQPLYKPFLQTRGLRSGFLCMVLLLLCIALPAAITLETIGADVQLNILSLEDGRNESPRSVPVCTLRVITKNPCPGRILVSHTPLSYGTRLFLYQLITEDGSDLDATHPLFYSNDRLDFPQVASIPIWARFNNPIASDAQYFESNISVNLILEK
ncbi:MAG: hypothetical protein AB7C91_00150 [Sphaerochaeta sp.]|uniref:hypothetical protein n=1 Tax=Sphaerochaeta sp. TaxID=1972642 RepID=UPI003D112DC7